MKVICDVHIAKKVAKSLDSKGVEAIHVNNILDKWYTDDQDIVNYADRNDFVVMSKDSDFKTSHLVKSIPKKLLKVNLGNLSTKRLIAILDENLEFLQEKFDAGKCLVEINSDSIVIIEI